MKLGQPEEEIYEKAFKTFGKYPSVIQMFPVLHEPEKFADTFAESIARTIIEACGKEAVVDTYFDELGIKPSPTDPAVRLNVLCFAISHEGHNTVSKNLEGLCRTLSRGKTGFKDSFSLYRAIMNKPQKLIIN